jgi:Tol biopolymer transport system component
MKRKSLVLGFLFVVPVTTLFSQKKGILKNEPEVFLPEKIATGNSERDMSISPSGDELFYTIQDPKTGYSQIAHLRKSENGMGSPETATFSGKYSDMEASFSPDGNKIYFVSNRPLKPNGKIKDYDIWVTERKNGKWEPINLGEPINSEQDEFYPSVSANGNIYFTAVRKNGIGKEDIFVSKFNNGKYLEATPLDTNINSKLYEFNAYVSPDESFIIFTGYGRKDDLGKGDLYMAKKDTSGNWMPAYHLGNKINSNALDYCPFVDFEKKKLYFTSEKSASSQLYQKEKKLDEFKNYLNNVGNGNGDIYFIPFNSINK